MLPTDHRTPHHGATLLSIVVIVAIIALSVLDFVRIDATSHSVSDTLINWVPQTVILVATGLGVVALLRRR